MPVRKFGELVDTERVMTSIEERDAIAAELNISAEAMQVAMAYTYLCEESTSYNFYCVPVGSGCNISFALNGEEWELSTDYDKDDDEPVDMDELLSNMKDDIRHNAVHAEFTEQYPTWVQVAQFMLGDRYQNLWGDINRFF
jgi:hypothetical protein